ncbi:MAG: DNA repair protein RadA [Clostridia bacterium]|nr:DNA repair protein RadA [Clostridia bacterium]
MPKAKTVYVCSECGYETPRWLGRCPDCGSWNTLTEQQAAPVQTDAPLKLKREPGHGAEPMRIDEIPDDTMLRYSSGIGELDRVLGGGIVEGSLVLVGGDPGIGKSTLLTQVSAYAAAQGRRVLYVSGEESSRQIKMRANRLGACSDSFYVLPENDMNNVSEHVIKLAPQLMIVDSIQTMYKPDMSSAPGSVSQVRECTSVLMRYAKNSGCAVMLVGHVTKEGAIAGPMVLEHMVDAVLYFEGDRQHQYRLLRAIKNRFGSVNELGMFEMSDKGMREVSNASDILLSERARGQSGSVVHCAIEGTRPLLVDVQALVATTVFGNPRRMASGVDSGRLALLLAVLEKRASAPLYNQDVYINIAGGITLDEPAADLSLCCSVVSALRNRPIDSGLVVMGEVGLGGEIRPISQPERRLIECARLGFTEAVVPKRSLRGITLPEGLRVIGVETVLEALYKLGLTAK